ncbi:MAG: LptF/LptG family permease [Gemmatimonadales bacterium]
MRLPRLALSEVIERIAVLAAPRHRDLVRAMVSELESIADPAERRRFAVGAVLAIIRLALIGRPETQYNPTSRDPSMPAIPTEQLLRRHVVPFTVAFAFLTVLQLADFAARQFPLLSARGASTGTLFEALLLAVPFTIALTIPMAVFIAVLWVFSRLGADGVILEAQQERHGFRRLVGPVLGVAAVIAALMFVSNAQILPQANGRLSTLYAKSAHPNDRSMTFTELRQAARNAATDAGPGAAARAAGYEVEIQKRGALAAASLVLAIAGAAIAARFPRGGRWLVAGASVVVGLGYYISLVVGEALAEQQVISPVVGMWMANAILLSLVLLLALRSRGSTIQAVVA